MAVDVGEIGLDDPLALDQQTAGSTPDPLADYGAGPSKTDAMSLFKKATAEHMIEMHRRNLDSIGSQIDTLMTNPRQDPTIAQRIQQDPTLLQYPDQLSKAVVDRRRQLGQDYTTTANRIKQLGATAGVATPMTQYQQDIAAREQQRIAETARHNQATEGRLQGSAAQTAAHQQALEQNAEARLRLSESNYSLNLAQKTYDAMNKMVQRGQGDTRNAITFANSVQSGLHNENMEAMKQYEVAQRALSYADTAMQRQYSTEQTAASSRYSTGMRESGAEARNTQDNVRQYAVEMTKAWADLAKQRAPAGTTALMERLIREKARRAGIPMPADWHLTPTPYEDVADRFTQQGATFMDQFSQHPAAQQQFAPPPMPQVQAPGGPLAGQTPPPELTPYPGFTPGDVTGIAGQFGAAAGTSAMGPAGAQAFGGLAAPGAAGGGFTMTGPRDATPMSQGARPAPAWIVDLIQRHTTDPALQNDPNFIRTVAAAILQESGYSPATVGDGGKSLGLFQIHEVHGLPASTRNDADASAALWVPKFEVAYREKAAQAPDQVGNPAWAGDVIQGVQRAYEGDLNGRHIDPRALYASAYQQVGPISLNAATSQPAAPPMGGNPIPPSLAGAYDPYTDPFYDPEEDQPDPWDYSGGQDNYDMGQMGAY